MCVQKVGRVSPWLRLAADWRLQATLGAVALALALAAGVAIGRRLGGVRAALHAAPQAPPPMAEAFPIADSWRAAAGGDERAYIECFVGEARAQAESRLATLGREAFRAELRADAEAALSIGWGPPEPAPDGALLFPVTVLRAEDEERLDYAVVKSSGGWRIRSVARRGRQAASPPASERLGPTAEQEGGR